MSGIVSTKMIFLNKNIYEPLRVVRLGGCNE